MTDVQALQRTISFLGPAAEDAVEVLNDAVEMNPIAIFDVVPIRAQIATIAMTTKKRHIAQTAARLLDKAARATDTRDTYAITRKEADQGARRWIDTPRYLIEAGAPPRFRETHYVFYRPQHGRDLRVGTDSEVLTFFSALPSLNISGWQNAVPIYVARAPETRGWRSWTRRPSPRRPMKT